MVCIYYLMFLDFLLFISFMFKKYGVFVQQDFQYLKRKTQENLTNGSKMFVYYSSTWNHLPKLSQDLNRKIYEIATEETPTLWCESCECYLICILNKKMVQKRNYYSKNNKYMCFICSQTIVGSSKTKNNIVF